MRHELNLELDNSRDKSDKKQVLLSVKGALHSKYKIKLGQSPVNEQLSLILQGIYLRSIFTKSVHSFEAQILQNMFEVPVQDLFESASPTRHNLWVRSQFKCVQTQSILIKCESQELHNVSQQHSKNSWARKIVIRAQNIFTKCGSQECLFA